MTTDAAAWRTLLDAATGRYRACGRFGYHFARGKLGHDPVFRHLVQTGLLAPAGVEPVRLLDIGSGQSLLASLADAMARLHGSAAWPVAWPAPARSVHYTGIELMPRDHARARAALHGLPHVRLVCGDMTREAFAASDVVVILDVLHYVPIAAQDAVLAKVHACLAPGGRLLLRIGDQQQRAGFAMSQWVDRIVTTIRGHRAPPTWGRPLPQWLATLDAIGFRTRAVPKSEGTPFANVLLVGERR